MPPFHSICTNCAVNLLIFTSANIPKLALQKAVKVEKIQHAG